MIYDVTFHRLNVLFNTLLIHILCKKMLIHIILRCHEDDRPEIYHSKCTKSIFSHAPLLSCNKSSVNQLESSLIYSIHCFRRFSSQLRFKFLKVVLLCFVTRDRTLCTFVFWPVFKKKCKSINQLMSEFGYHFFDYTCIWTMLEINTSMKVIRCVSLACYPIGKWAITQMYKHTLTHKTHAYKYTQHRNPFSTLWV